MIMDIPVRLGLYEHYKKKPYQLIAIAKNSDTMEDFVVYQALYGEHLVWVKPAVHFFGEVEVAGVRQPRFRFLEK